MFSRVSIKDKSRIGLSSKASLTAAKLTLFLAISLSATVANASVYRIAPDWDWALTSEQVRPSNTVFDSGNQDTQTRLHGYLDASINAGNFSALLTYYGQNLASSETQDDDHHQWLAREWVWQDTMTIADNDIDYSIGKLRVDWGLGYGFRPLDILDSRSPNPVGVSLEEGVGALSFSVFDDVGDWTLIAADTDWQVQDSNALVEKEQAKGVGIRRFVFSDQIEWQWTSYYDQQRETILAAGALYQVNDVLSLHTSARYQAKYWHYQAPNTLAAPELKEDRKAVFAMLGFNYTSYSGHQWIVEYGYDSRAWSKSQWNQAIEFAKQASLTPQTAPLAASYQLGFLNPNRTEHNVMVHWNLNLSHWCQSKDFSCPNWVNDTEIRTDLMVSPVDAGVIATQWLEYTLFDSGESAVYLELAGRYSGGKNESIYDQLTNQQQWVLNLKGKF